MSAHHGSTNLTIWARANQIIQYVWEKHDLYYSGTKAQLACVLGGEFLDYRGAIPDPRVDRIEEAAAYTKDRPEEFSGMVIAYAPNDGGVAVVDPDMPADLPPQMLVSIVRGDMARQQQQETEMRRRIPIYQAWATSCSRSGDYELASILTKCEHEIDTDGRVRQLTRTDLFKALGARNLL